MALGVNLAQHVKQKRLHVVIQRLVVQEQLREQAQVLAVHPRLPAVHLVHAQPRAGLRAGAGVHRGWMAIDLIPGRMRHGAPLLPVPHQRLLPLHVLQAPLAHEQLTVLDEVVRVGRVVPAVDLVPTHLDHLHVLHPRLLLVLLLDEPLQRRHVLRRALHVVHLVHPPLPRPRQLTVRLQAARPRRPLLDDVGRETGAHVGIVGPVASCVEIAVARGPRPNPLGRHPLVASLREALEVHVVSNMGSGGV